MTQIKYTVKSLFYTFVELRKHLFKITTKKSSNNTKQLNLQLLFAWKP